MIEIVDEKIENPTIIKVIGVGGAGCNAINRMIEVGIKGVEFIAANTDIQHLKTIKALIKIQLGPKTTDGLGAGGIPEVGEKAAIETKDEIAEALKNADMVFIAAGMGGGTGTGASPVIASIAKEMNILTVGVVTKPFGFEGKRRKEQAESGINNLMKYVDSLIVLNNDNILKNSPKNISYYECFALANDVLKNAVQGVAELITGTGLINLDFADLKSVMSNKGRAVMGCGVGRGENKAIEAIENAISSPFLENNSIEGATGVLINIASGDDIKIQEVNQIVSTISKQIDENANLIYGHIFDKELKDEIKVTIVATGFKDNNISVQPQQNVIEMKTTAMQFKFIPDKELEKPAFKRYLNLKDSKIGSEDKIVKELSPEQKLNDKIPQIFFEWDQQNYDIPAYLRVTRKEKN